MIRFEDMATGKAYPPASEASRIKAVDDNRKLYEGDFRPLALRRLGTLTQVRTDEGTTGTTPFDQVGMNFFRRVTNVYADFLFSEEVTLETGNPGMDATLALLNAHLTDVMWAVNIDLQRFGVSVVTTDEDQQYFRVISPDRWFPVHDDAGRLIGDITTEHVYGARDTAGTLAGDTLLVSPNVVQCQINDYGDSTRRIVRFAYDTKNLGEVLSETTVEIAEGVRQVAIIYNGYVEREQFGTSIFDDMREVVKSIIQSAGALSGTIFYNSKPWMYGPPLKTMGGRTLTNVPFERSKDAIIKNLQQQYIAVDGEQGERDPGFLQYEPNVDAQRFEHERNMTALYTLTGLSPILFESGANRNVISGAAMRRLLIPFLSKLERMRRSNDELLLDMVTLWNAARAIIGGEVYSFSPARFNVSWGYERLFSDDVEPEPENTVALAEGA